MKEKIKGSLLRYGIIAAIGLFLTWFVLWVNDFNAVTDEVKRLKLLADCTSVPGMVLIMVGILVKLSSFGAVDGLGYALGGLFRSLIPGGRTAQADRETYYEYIQRRRAKHRGSIVPFFVVGAVFMAVSLVFIYRFYQIY